MDEGLQGNLSGFPNWEPRSRAGIYLGHSPFYVDSVAMLLNPATVHVSPKLHVVFDDEFSTFPFMRDITISSNCIYLVQSSSQIGAPDNICLKDTWFIPDIEEDPRETPRHDLSFAP